MVIAGPDPKANLELIGLAERLAPGLSARVSAVVLGPLTSLPVAMRYHVPGELFGAYQPDRFLEALTHVARQVEPALILCAHDHRGQELAPRLAARLSAGCVTDCIALSVQEGRVLAHKPVFGGKALATYGSRRPTLVASVRPGSQEPAENPVQSGGATMELPVLLGDRADLTRVVEQMREAASGPRLEDARIVVAAGRGVGSAEGFRQVQGLATVLGAALGATRVACDAGWCPVSLQIGQTGKIVAPDLYIGVGISGAMQHLAGLTGARIVIAINNDPEAPIFKRATLGLVADYRQVLPALIEQCREALSG